MIVTLEEVKGYLKEDCDDEKVNKEILDLVEAAEEYLVNAGCVLSWPDETPKKLATLAIKQLVTHWYENREPVGKADKISYSLNSIIPQLKYC